MLMPAPTEAASPTLKVARVFTVAKAAANKGARVETEPSINPRKPRLNKAQYKQPPEPPLARGLAHPK